MKFVLIVVIGIVAFVAGYVSGIIDKEKDCMQQIKEAKTLPDLRKEVGLPIKEEEEAPALIPTAADARMLAQLAIENGYINSPQKRNLLNEMKEKINIAIASGRTYLEFDADMTRKIRINFTRAELDTIFGELGYVIRYNEYGEFKWISWDKFEKADSDEVIQMQNVMRMMRDNGQVQDLNDVFVVEPIPEIKPVFSKTS